MPSLVLIKVIKKLSTELCLGLEWIQIIHFLQTPLQLISDHLLSNFFFHRKFED